MILHVVRAEWMGDFRIHLWFNDDTDGEVDLNGTLTGPIFHPLNSPEYFRQFKLEGYTLTWDNGADFAPEYLHRLVHAQSAV